MMNQGNGPDIRSALETYLDEHPDEQMMEGAIYSVFSALQREGRIREFQIHSTSSTPQSLDMDIKQIVCRVSFAPAKAGFVHLSIKIPTDDGVEIRLASQECKEA